LSRNWPRCVLVCLGCAICLEPVARAQSLQEELRACSAETDAARRLRCFDRATAMLDQAAASPAPAARSSTARATSGTAAASTPPSSEAAEFGVREGPLDAKRRATALKQIRAVVAAIEFRPRGELVMTLDNGQVWAQNDATAYFPLKVGDTVQISSATLGSYVLLAPSKRATKVTRVR
jgi:hypothetical protein